MLPTSTTEDEQALNADVAILPIGSFEQHGPYLPLTTDTIIACTIGQAIADKYPIRLLSPITISCSHEHSAWSGTVSISAATLYAIIHDIRDSLKHQGIRKLVLLNAHGGNYVLRNVVQESTTREDAMALFPTNTDWATARTAAGIVTSNHEDMHAGEAETSILLHACPEFVRNGYQTADQIANERDLLLTRGMQFYTPSGVIGRPSLASAAKGRVALASLVEAFASCLAILADTERITT